MPEESFIRDAQVAILLQKLAGNKCFGRRRGQMGERLSITFISKGQHLQGVVVQDVAQGGVDRRQPEHQAPGRGRSLRQAFKRQGDHEQESAAKGQRDGCQGKGIHFLAARCLASQYAEEGEADQPEAENGHPQRLARLESNREEQSCPAQRDQDANGLQPGGDLFQPENAAKEDEQRDDAHHERDGGGGQILQRPEHGAVADGVGAHADQEETQPHPAREGVGEFSSTQHEGQQHQKADEIEQPADGQRAEVFEQQFDEDERGGPNDVDEEGFDNGEGVRGFFLH